MRTFGLKNLKTFPFHSQVSLSARANHGPENISIPLGDGRNLVDEQASFHEHQYNKFLRFLTSWFFRKLKHRTLLS